MRRYNFVVNEQPDSNGIAQYSIQIAALDEHSLMVEKGLVTAIKKYENEKSFRRDVEADFTNFRNGELKRNQVVYLADERAKYYGWVAQNG
jgi:hypothetical protein